MKKYIPYLIIILALGGAATWFYLHNTPESINKREGDFAVPEKDITKVVMQDEKGGHIEITKGNGLWMVNSKYVAREELVKQLLEAVSRVTSLAPVPKNGHDNVIRDITTKYIKVSVFENNSDKPSKSYWVGGPTVDGRGTYMLLDMGGKAASRPHITYVPGLQGYLTPRFEMDAEVWRSRVVFNYQPEEIQSLKVEYPADETKSFFIHQVAADSFAVEPLNEANRINVDYEQKYVKQYLSFYSSIYMEAFDNSNAAKDSISKTTPYCIFTVTEKDSSVNQVKMFYMPFNKRSKALYDEKGFPMTYDVDRYYATVHNGEDFTIVQYYVFGKLLRQYKDFFFKPTEAAQ